MPAPIEAVDAAIHEVEGLRKNLRKSNQPQVRSSDERLLAKSVALGWFQRYRDAVIGALGETALTEVDADYRSILESSARSGARPRYISTLTRLQTRLVTVRSKCLSSKPPANATSDAAPDFSPLIGDPAMQRILAARWNECLTCLNAKAALAATVMMGGLLEALLLSIEKPTKRQSLPLDRHLKTRRR